MNEQPHPSIPSDTPSITEVGEQLALTGSQTWLLVGIGLAIIFLGALAVITSKRGA